MLGSVTGFCGLGFQVHEQVATYSLFWRGNLPKNDSRRCCPLHLVPAIARFIDGSDADFFVDIQKL